VRHLLANGIVLNCIVNHYNSCTAPPTIYMLSPPHTGEKNRIHIPLSWHSLCTHITMFMHEIFAPFKISSSQLINSDDIIKHCKHIYFPLMRSERVCHCALKSKFSSLGGCQIGRSAKPDFIHHQQTRHSPR
jgi:hypothetical protein